MNANSQQLGWKSDLHPPRLLWILLLALPLAAFILLLMIRSSQVLPRLALVPGYSLVDQDGARITNEDMRGNFVIYALFPEECAGCQEADATLLEIQQAAQELLPGDQSLRFVVVNGDPAIQMQGADQAGIDWHLVNADPNQFKILRQDVPSNAPIFGLADGWGIVRALYVTPDASQVTRDLRRIEQEVRNSTGVNRYAYEAVHLFMCHNGL